MEIINRCICEIQLKKYLQCISELKLIKRPNMLYLTIFANNVFFSKFI